MSADRIVIFDMDGVLVDSEPIAIRVCAEVITAAGIPVSYDDIDAFVGTPGPVMYAELERRDDHKLPNDIGKRIQLGLAEAYKSELKLMPGVEDVLVGLSGRWCIASNSSRGRISVTLEAVGLTDVAGERVFSADDVPRGKPAPDLFLLAAQEMGARPEDCLVVEDSKIGVAAALAAKIDVVGFVGGGHMNDAAAKRLIAAGAMSTFTTMSALKGFLNSVD